MKAIQFLQWTLNAVVREYSGAERRSITVEVPEKDLEKVPVSLRPLALANVMLEGLGLRNFIRNEKELNEQIMRLPKPPDEIGDGPQERVSWALSCMGTTMNELAQESMSIAVDRGWLIPPWEDPNGVPAFLALIHSEVIEALEDFRENRRVGFGEELADIIIRVLHLAAHLGIDIDEEVRGKMQRNQTRPYRHGGKTL